MVGLHLYALLGLAVGYIGGFAGIGGGPFLVSAMVVLLFGVPQLTAQGIVLTMMLGPMSLLGAISLYDQVKTMWRNIFLGALFYCISSYFGAVLAFDVGEEKIRTYFAVLLFVIAGIQVLSLLFNIDNIEDRKTDLKWYWAALLGAFTGFFGGLLGIGAGVLMVPILMYIFNIRKEYARALSLSILVPPVSLGAYFKYNLEVDIDWMIVGTLFITYFISNYFGAKMGTKMPRKTFQIVYSIVLFMLGVVYLT